MNDNISNQVMRFQEITDKQWSMMKPHLPKPTRTGRPEGTDIYWLIEHRGGFIILEFKEFHNDKINISKGQMRAYEKLYEKLNMATKCYLCVVGCDDIDFSNLDSTVWIFEMNQWKSGGQYQRILQISMMMLR